MEDTNRHLEQINDIKQLMERSSRFISLSGWSGIAAGVCALVGAWLAYGVIHPAGDGNGVRNYATVNSPKDGNYSTLSLSEFMGHRLFVIAIVTFAAAFVLAFIFTYLRSKKTGLPLWGSSARRLMVNVSIPMIAGGIFLVRLVQTGTFGLIAPGCLIFYGLALVNASKYTLGEVRYLGYGQIILGLINCWFIGCGLYFWAAGFGVLHIIYGGLMLMKYERTTK